MNEKQIEYAIVEILKNSEQRDVLKRKKNKNLFLLGASTLGIVASFLLMDDAIMYARIIRNVSGFLIGFNWIPLISNLIKKAGMEKKIKCDLKSLSTLVDQNKQKELEEQEKEERVK
jgi:hypothetical protein